LTRTPCAAGAWRQPALSLCVRGRTRRGPRRHTNSHGGQSFAASRRTAEGHHLGHHADRAHGRASQEA
jgi:hypothetical protein